jgi:hypothetical protein
MRELLGILLLLPLLGAAELKLLPPYDAAHREYSGLAWHGDRLLLLPQYPDGCLPALERSQLHRAVRNGTPLQPSRIPFDDSAVRSRIRGYEGYEAIAVAGERFFGLVEARPLFGGMKGYLVRGRIGKRGIVVERMREITLPHNISNYAFEAMTVTPEKVYLLYEANGIGEKPFAYALSHDLKSLESVPMEPVPYRITDLTALHNTRAWALNSFWIGDREKLKAGKHGNLGRIIELEWTPSGIRCTGRGILLNSGGVSYNWEGIVRFGRGFIVITDTHPGTVIRYVENQEKR